MDKLTNDLNEFEDFVHLHSHQLLSSMIPECFWKSLLFKLNNQLYDAGDYFQMCQIICEDETSKENWQVNVINENGVTLDNINCIFIIDHAWSYKANDARKSLKEHEGLLKRMCNLMNITYEEANKNSCIEKVLNEMWLYNGTYNFGNRAADENIPIWYIMDEFGSRIQHDGDPNCRVVPFYYLPHDCCYSILFPIKDIFVGEEITRNYCETPEVSETVRDAQMLAWFPMDLTNIDTNQEEPSEEFFKSARMQEVLPTGLIVEPLPSDRKAKVFTDYDILQKYLTDERFEFTNYQDEADIIWISTHFKDFKKLNETPWKRVNQFPCEHLLTVKDMLAIISRRCSPTINTDPSWMLKTFCLKSELDKFVSYFQKNEKSNMDNTWIIKPWNLARGIDHTVTDKINCIIRLATTGPKIAQKYIHDPVLFYREDINSRVKFDLRFIIILINARPLKVAMYNRFWIRFANKPFILENFDDYQTHYTVNNYNDKFLLQMFCHDFIEKFNSQYPDYSWSDIENEICKMVKELFTGATEYDYPLGIPNNAQSRGSYGFDVMIDWQTNEKGERLMQPKLLEVNFNSDCKRACEYYPDFFNDLFRLMFLDDETVDSIKFL